MKSENERDALLKLVFQHLALGQNEFARVLFYKLCQLEISTARQVLECLPQGSDIPDWRTKAQGGKKSYGWAQQLWGLACVLSTFKNEEDAQTLLKVLLGVYLEQLGTESKWEVRGYSEDAQDGPETLGAVLTESEVQKMSAGIARILSGSKSGNLKEVLGKVAESKGLILWAIAQTIRNGIPEEKWASTGVIQFLHDCDTALLNAAGGFLQNGNMKAAMKTLGYVQGDRAKLSAYRTVLQRAVKYLPSALQADLLQVVLGCGNPAGLSKTLQEFLDVSLQHITGEAGAEQASQGSSAVSKWKSAGFQEAKSMQRHMGAHELQMIVEQCQKGNTIPLVDAINKGKNRTACLAALLAWDSIGSSEKDDMGQLFRAKRGIAEAVDVVSLQDTELAYMLPSLKTQVQLAMVLASRRSEKYDDPKAGKSLMALSKGSLLELMNKSALFDMDSYMVRSMVGCTADMPCDVQIPMVRDVQLVTTSGVIVSMVAILTICSKLLDAKDDLSEHGSWLKEAESLMETIRVCLAGLKGSYIHAWLLSVLLAIFHLVAVKPEEASGVELQIIPDESNLESSGQSCRADEVLGFLLKLLNMLSDSADTVSKEVQQRAADGAWDASAAGIHLQFVKETLSGLKSGLLTLIRITRAAPGVLIIQNGWKGVGSFLTLREAAFDLLENPGKVLSRSVAEITRDVDTCTKNGSVDVPEAIERMGLLMDGCISKNVDWEEASLAVETLLKALERMPYNAADVEIFQIQALFTVASGIKKVLEGAKSAPDLSEVLGKYPGHRSSDGGKTTLKSVPRVRRLTEHVKALARLRDAVNAANRGRLQYLSGLLHNLSRALTSDDSLSDLRGALEVAGYGPSLELAVEARSKSILEDVVPLSPKGTETGYLSDMVNYLAAVGDVTSTWDDGPTEGHNYFAMLGQEPQEILSSLVSKSHTRDHIEATAKVASILQVDLVREIRKSWLAPVIAPCFQATDPNGSSSTQSFHCKDPVYVKHMPSRGAVNALATLAPVRVLLMSVMYSLQRDLLEVTDEAGGPSSLLPQPGVEDTDAVAMFALEKSAAYPMLHTWLKSEVSKGKKHAVTQALKSELEDGEEEYGIRQQIEVLLSAGKYCEAMQCLEGANQGDSQGTRYNDILAMIIERFPKDLAEGLAPVEPGSDADLGPLTTMPISLVACLKVGDRAKAIELAGDRFLCWPLESAIHFYSLMQGRLDASGDQSDVAQNVARKNKQLLLYREILQSQLGSELQDWVEIHRLFETDPGPLVRRLIAAGAFAEAMKVVDMKPVPDSLKLAAQATYTQELANGSAATGSGPAAALRYLRGLSVVQAFEVGMKVLTSAPSLRLCRLLVQFLMSLKEKLPPKSVKQLKQLELGLAALRCLQSAWSDRLAHLVENPELIVESLIMAQQTVAIRKLLKEVPALQDDSVLIHYGRKALGLGPDSQMVPPFLANVVDTTPTADAGIPQPEKLGSGSGPRRALARFPSDTLEAGAGVAVNVLSGITSMDEVLLDMCSKSEVAAAAASRAAKDLAHKHLESPFEEYHWDPVVAQHALDAVDVCLRLLDYSANLSRDSRDTEKSSSVAQTQAPAAVKTGAELEESGMGKKAPARSSLRIEVELLQKILQANIRSSLHDIRDPSLCEILLQELISKEQYNLAVSTAKYCGVDERPFWEAWVCALFQEGKFDKAREKVGNVFRIEGAGGEVPDDAAKLESRQAALRLVRVLETTSPVDVEAFKRLHESLKRSRWGFLRVSASGLVNALRKPDKPSPSQPKQWWNPKKMPKAPPPPRGMGDNIKRKVLAIAATASTLLNERVKFAEELLAAHAPRTLIPFMFKHGRGSPACQVMFPSGLDDELPVSTMSGSGKFGSSFRSSFSRSANYRSGDAGSRSAQHYRRTSSRDAHGSSESSADISLGESSSRTMSTAASPKSQSPQIGNGTTPEGKGQQTSSSQPVISGVNARSLAQDIENVTQLCELCVRYAKLDSMIDAMTNGGTRGKRCLKEACTWLENENKISHLYSCQKALGLFDAAGLSCLRLSQRSRDGKAAMEYLDLAVGHFQTALSSFQKKTPGSSSKEQNTLDQRALTTFVSRCHLQAEVYKVLTTGAKPRRPRDCFLLQLGPEETEEDARHRTQVVSDLITTHFHLAFKVLNTFKMSCPQAYAAAACEMAESRHHEAIRQLIHNIKGTVTDSELDRILAAAVDAYTKSDVGNAGDDVDWTSWFAEGCIELMVSPHAKVLACLQLGDTDKAFRIAKERGGYQDLTMVAEAAQKLGDKATARRCEKILGRTHSSG